RGCSLPPELRPSLSRESGSWRPVRYPRGDIRSSHQSREAVAPHPTPTRRARWHLAAGIVLAALNLRTAITSIGPLLTEITTDLHLTPVTTGLLTTLPVLCFAGFGALTPALQRRW